MPSCSINVLEIATEVIRILQCIHERGLSHNDIKPDHIVFDSQGLFLIDFGGCTKLGSDIPFITQKFCPNRALLNQECVCALSSTFYINRTPPLILVLCRGRGPRASRSSCANLCRCSCRERRSASFASSKVLRDIGTVSPPVFVHHL
jgi:serine/threonine protein kinase